MCGGTRGGGTLQDILTAFAALWAIGAVGWLIGRHGLLGPGAETVLARLVFFVAAPALLLVTVSTTPLTGIFTAAFVPFLASTALIALGTAVIARWRWRVTRGEGTVAVLTASYVNAGYLGIPIAAFVLGDLAYAVPVVLFQILVFAPIALALLDNRRGARSLLSLPARTPIMPACMIGLVITISGWDPPAAVLRPFELVGAAAVPLALLALGLSLGGVRQPRNGPETEIRYSVVIAKVLLQPALAFILARLLGLEGTMLLAAVIMSGLPTAQNVFVFATRYGEAAELARDAVVLSTVAAAITLVGAALLLG